MSTSPRRSLARTGMSPRARAHDARDDRLLVVDEQRHGEMRGSAHLRLGDELVPVVEIPFCWGCGMTAPIYTAPEEHETERPGQAHVTACSGCHVALYCSEACFLKHWNEVHESQCELLASGGMLVDDADRHSPRKRRSSRPRFAGSGTAPVSLAASNDEAAAAATTATAAASQFPRLRTEMGRPVISCVDRERLEHERQRQREARALVLDARMQAAAERRAAAAESIALRARESVASSFELARAVRAERQAAEAERDKREAILRRKMTEASTRRAELLDSVAARAAPPPLSSTRSTGLSPREQQARLAASTERLEQAAARRARQLATMQTRPRTIVYNKRLFIESQ